MTTRKFDLVVLGAGSGGIATAIRAARHGARVAVVEPDALGGTCVNVGCVPKKAMWLAAELAESLKLSREVGFDTSLAALDWAGFVQRRERYIRNIHASYRSRFDALGIETVSGRGRFVAPGQVAVAGAVLEAPHVLIATGARPKRPAIPGAELGIDSNGFFGLRAAPRRVAIVGGGYIAIELAGVLDALGTQTALFVRSRLLKEFDAEAVAALEVATRARGIDVVRGRDIVSVRREEDGLVLSLDDGTEARGFDELIWATGRRPNSDDAGLETIGVALDERGHVLVDEWQDTHVSGVHAVGDVTGKIALTPVAVAAGRTLADRLFGGKAQSKLDYADVPTVVFAHPPLATIGLSEQDARRQHGAAVRVYRTGFRPMRAALADRDERTFMKLVCVGDEERVVGIHLVGSGVDEMLQGFAVALKAGARKADFDATVAIHPTASEELVLMTDAGEPFDPDA